MKVSARNVFKGKLTAIHPGAVNAEVELTTAGGDPIVSIVTMDSLKTLGLAIGTEATAIVKAPWVIVVAGDSTARFSARNHLLGTVSEVTKGGVNSEVAITLKGGTQVYAVVTNEAVAELGLAPGKAAGALIKSSHVILAVGG